MLRISVIGIGNKFWITGASVVFFMGVGYLVYFLVSQKIPQSIQKDIELNNYCDERDSASSTGSFGQHFRISHFVESYQDMAITIAYRICGNMQDAKMLYKIVCESV